MSLLSLYRNGETLSWADRCAIAYLRSMGFPLDYLWFISKYGAGEIPFVLTAYGPARFLSSILDDAAEIEVGHTDEGLVWAFRSNNRFRFRIESDEIDLQGSNDLTWGKGYRNSRTL